MEDQAWKIDITRAALISSPRVLEMISRVHIMHDPGMDGLGYSATPVKISMRNGTVHETVGQVRSSGGDDPITKDDVVAKFRKMTRTCWPSATQDRAIGLCDNLESLEDATELTSSLEMQHLPPMDMGGE